MELLFGRRRTPEELLRQQQRALGRAMRELDRERQKLEAQEKKLVADIKKMAKQGQMVGTRRGRGRGMAGGRGDAVRTGGDMAGGHVGAMVGPWGRGRDSASASGTWGPGADQDTRGAARAQRVALGHR